MSEQGMGWGTRSELGLCPARVRGCHLCAHAGSVHRSHGCPSLSMCLTNPELPGTTLLQQGSCFVRGFRD